MTRHRAWRRSTFKDQDRRKFLPNLVFAAWIGLAGFTAAGLAEPSSRAVQSGARIRQAKKTKRAPPSAPVVKASPLPSVSAPVAPRISTLARAEVLDRVIREREVMTHADLQNFKVGTEFYPEIRPVVLPVPVKSGLFGGSSKMEFPKKPEFEAYDFYVAVLVKASLKRTREVLTNYKVYSDLVPYISRAEYFRASKMLQIEGGIWRYRINSRVRFDERGEGWIRFRIASGHFRGMEGEILLEPVGEQGADGTLVFMRGQSIANRFPPAFVIEQGAQVVFGMTANRIRTYIESGKIPPPMDEPSLQPVSPVQERTPSPLPGEKASGEHPHESELPQPRRRF